MLAKSLGGLELLDLEQRSELSVKRAVSASPVSARPVANAGRANAGPASAAGSIAWSHLGLTCHLSRL